MTALSVLCKFMTSINLGMYIYVSNLYNETRRDKIGNYSENVEYRKRRI